jgi:hypothetical protein
MKKTLKFRNYLVPLVKSGDKDLTWRLFDDKDLKEEDEVDLINWNTGEKFGEGIITKVWEKEMGKLEKSDFDGHEKFNTEEEMYKTYNVYYGEGRVTPKTIVKIMRFELKNS